MAISRGRRAGHLPAAVPAARRNNKKLPEERSLAACTAGEPQDTLFPCRLR
jgi:hypothetical protein